MRRYIGGAATAMTLVVGSLLITTPAHAAPTCTAAALTTTCVFSYTGRAEVWTAPPGVVEVSADLFGAQGGSIETFTTGGFGGRATASLATLPGSQLVVMVGGRGESVPGCESTLDIASGGFNGGGDGGGTGIDCRGAGGGGATDIRSATGTLTDRVLIAGGGGGSANGSSGAGPYFGGAGGGLIGQTGGPATSGGLGGSQIGGGSGLLGQGGAGSLTAGFIGGAGGGGGGYYGGEGGSEFPGIPGRTSYGGGGGSGYGPIGTDFMTGVRAEDGEAILMFPSVTVSSITASAVSLSSADLTVTVNPNGRVGLPLRILYGTDSGALTSEIVLDAVSGSAPVTLARALTGLSPATTYFFRAEVPADPTTPAVTAQLTTVAAPSTPGIKPPTPGIKPPAPTVTAPAAGGISTGEELPRSLAQSGGSDLGFWGLMALGALGAGGLLIARRRRAAGRP